MKIKSDHLLSAAGACLGSGLALILFGAGRLLNNQPGDTMLTAGGIVLLIGLALYRISDAVAAEEERRKSRYGKIQRNHARNPEYPALPERSSRWGA